MESATKAKKVQRNFPLHSLEDAIAVGQKIEDEMGGKPFKRLLLSEALGFKPASSNFRDVLSSSFKYGLTDGTEKASEISLTSLGGDVVQSRDGAKRTAALRKAAMTPQVFRAFYSTYTDKKLPSPDMMRKLLVSEYNVPAEYANDCSQLIVANGRFAHLIRDIGGSPHVMLDSVSEPEVNAGEPADAEEIIPPVEAPNERDPSAASALPLSAPPRAIFIGHGKKRGPLDKLQKFLTSFQIPHKVVIDEANLGRPISQKVKDTMLLCGSAILIFTCDEELRDKDGNVVWRPSENVVHELGAASYAYEDRVVIFKEKGIQFPTNFQNVGYIEFEEDGIESKTADLLKELIGFGLVRITTAA